MAKTPALISATDQSTGWMGSWGQQEPESFASWGSPYGGERSNMTTLATPEPLRRQVVESRTISLTRLAHQPPKKAVKAFRRGQSASKAGKNAKAAEHYERAVEIDGEWLEARVNLGAQYYRLGLAEKAIEQLGRAIEIDPSSASAFSNLSAAYSLSGLPGAAERAARQSIDLDPFLPTGRYVLGIALWDLGRTGEAVDQWRLAASDLEAVRQLLARVGELERSESTTTAVGRDSN